MQGVSILLFFFLIVLFAFSKAFRRFSLRAFLGILTLILAKLLNIGVALNYTSLALSSFLGVGGALSFIAISKIL